MNDNDIIKAFDILDKFEFFGGQRAGRELWFNKPADIQNKDIGGFLRDLDFLKTFINCQKAEIERLYKTLNAVQCEQYTNGRNDGIKEFAERLKAIYGEWLYDYRIDDLVKEITEGEDGNL